jgi:hypothetical protein
VPRLRISGGVTPLTIYAFIACIGTILPLPFIGHVPMQMQMDVNSDILMLSLKEVHSNCVGTYVEI